MSFQNIVLSLYAFFTSNSVRMMPSQSNEIQPMNYSISQVLYLSCILFLLDSENDIFARGLFERYEQEETQSGTVRGIFAIS